MGKIKEVALLLGTLVVVVPCVAATMPVCIGVEVSILAFFLARKKLLKMISKRGR